MVGGEARLEAGAVFAGDYRIVRPLAEGGMGAVYVVDQISTGKARALKVMKAEIANDADSRRRFELEARAGASIESEHVVEIHSAGVEGDTPYIVMELLDGEDLGTRIERAGPLTSSEVRELFEQLCHAVAAAHAAGLVHRDLKPENVFLARSKRAGGQARFDVKVLDFGIAKHVAESATRGQTMGMIGTPMWMAPEQTEPGKTTPAADVWALGLILYFVMTGHPYWLAAGNPEATFTQLLKEVVMGPLPPATQRARAQGISTMPPEIDGVFARSVVRDPRQRYANAQQFWEALHAVLAPSSVRILTDAGAAAGARTIGATPMPFPASAPPPVRPIEVPPLRPASFDHGAGMSTTMGSPSWMRLWPIPVMLIGAFVIGQCVVSRRSTATRELDERRPGAVALAPDPPLGRQPQQSACRLCSTGMTAKGGVQREAVHAAIEAGLPTLDQQCLVPPPRRGKQKPSGAVTYAFEIREGRATNRRIQRSTSTDGTDECLLRGWADVTFPSSPEETEVTVTLAFNASLPH